jgi:Tol biopolymer transport system component
VVSVADKKATPIINSPFNETHAQVSPDGKWIAFTSDSVGQRREIHVQPFPSGAGHWQVSDAGGDWPRWQKDGKTLFYHSIGPIATPQTPGNQTFVGPIYSVAVNGTGASFEHAPPRGLVNLRAINFPHGGGHYHTYAVAPDGQRFLYFQFAVPPTALAGGAQTVTPDHPSGLVVAMNWARQIDKK